ncbi:MAG: hypothetical protein ACRD2A_14845 [Vicinamibacterales bacterium]
MASARVSRVRKTTKSPDDFNPIEAAWALVKKRIRSYGPRTPDAFGRVARAARHAVEPWHLQQWFAHAGYVNSSTFRD